jgi:hypothetical protein
MVNKRQELPEGGKSPPPRHSAAAAKICRPSSRARILIIWAGFSGARQADRQKDSKKMRVPP